MANSVTYLGQLVMLKDDAGQGMLGLGGSINNVGGIVKQGVSLRLYTSASTPQKDGSGFTEVASGNGYSAKTLNSGSYTLTVVSANVRATIADQVWTASGGQILNIGGAYLADADGNVLCWWERTSALTLNPGETITADDLYIGMQ